MQRGDVSTTDRHPAPAGEETGTHLDEPDRAITIRQRKSIGFVTTARPMFARYPRRTILGLSLFIGQAFLYNAITSRLRPDPDRLLRTGPEDIATPLTAEDATVGAAAS